MKTLGRRVSKLEAATAAKNQRWVWWMGEPRPENLGPSVVKLPVAFLSVEEWLEKSLAGIERRNSGMPAEECERLEEAEHRSNYARWYHSLSEAERSEQGLLPPYPDAV